MVIDELDRQIARRKELISDIRKTTEKLSMLIRNCSVQPAKPVFPVKRLTVDEFMAGFEPVKGL